MQEKIIEMYKDSGMETSYYQTKFKIMYTNASVTLEFM